MPKIANDYSKVVIYKLVHKDALDDANIYVGSTTNFTKRKCTHKKSCNYEKSQGYNLPKYVFIRNNGGWNEWNMIEVEKYPCVDNNEARAREEYWRRSLSATLNGQRCFTTKEEKIENAKIYGDNYRNNNSEKIAEGKKKYNHNNKEKIAEKRKKYMYNNIEKYKKYFDEYREENKEELKEKRVIYNNNHKEKRAETNSIKVQCPICGTLGAKNKLKRHQETVKCLSFLKSIPLVE